MPKVSFKVSARTARLIGQENFANAEGAVIELVKNCYDADAKNGIVFFDNTHKDSSKHRIIILDNGHGMTDTIIKNHWMMIGTDNKEIDFKTKSGRIKTGAKGIGRFALDKLGGIAEMYTLPEGETDGFYWKVNWSDFEQKDTALSKIEADLNNQKPLDLKLKVLELTNDFPALAQAIKDKEFNKGTLLVISNLNQQWEESKVKKLFNNLEILIPPKEQRVFAIHLFSNSNPDSYGELSSMYFDDFDYHVSAKYLGDKNHTIKIKIHRNELDFNELKNNYSDIFKSKLLAGEKYKLSTFNNKPFEYTIGLNELIKGSSEVVDKALINKIGAFNFSFYFLKNTKSDDKNSGEYDIDKKYPYADFNSSNRKAWLERFGGIKIFRDDFRIRPYGELGNDWLDLGKRYTKNPQGPGQRLGGYSLRPNQISGTISISRIYNPQFKDKSNREGIQENETFILFKEVIKGIIAEFEKDRNLIMFSLRELYDKREEKAKTNREAEELARKVLESSKPEQSKNPLDEPIKNDKKPTENELVMAQNIEDKINIIHDKEEEIRLLRGLAGTGLIVASFAHELRGLRSLLASRSQDLKEIIESIVDKETIKNLPLEDNPITLLNQMREQDGHLKHWLDYSLTALKRDRRTRSNIDITVYFDNFKSSWSRALSRRKVSISVHNKLNETVSLKGFLIDLDTIFNNLLANSLDSFKRKLEKSERLVEIFLSEKENHLVVLFKDNGAGLSDDFSDPTEIFLPFVTSKVSKRGNKTGTGIGMYLVKTIVNDYRGALEINTTKDGFELELRFPLRKK